MKSNSNGFTLIELLVVLVILGVMSSLVFVSVGRSITKKRTRLFAQEMVSLCRKARRLAITHGNISTFYISSEERKCWIDKENPIDIPPEMRVEGKGIHELEHGIFGIRFFPDGSSSGGALFLSRDEEPLLAFRVDLLTGLILPMDEEG
ncbi:MAG: prepilin-type N-terminal cleavage/methylation domain-containing protein [Deltaproteobacteria bacterium]|nr:prepilin-type N-terminal cleavage/methylation domain-containing protein [Deltaproteobacteria bacterium]MBW2022317.1 prepilin-type N-terminal cleavage/methylation domain-containing protein [Deltaproteobacteria bacterium]MBW2082573.1 prepilin-type N-terminal cleavage/methylation domain-containing protein [Deltaproteobacteria bacterium]HDM08995.1 prepilin-type N-terminal cleavage/methylation domain-containing protein [Desulfobacteraceae bacterium]